MDMMRFFVFSKMRHKTPITRSKTANAALPIVKKYNTQPAMANKTKYIRIKPLLNLTQTKKMPTAEVSQNIISCSATETRVK